MIGWDLFEGLGLELGLGWGSQKDWDSWVLDYYWG